MDFNRLLAPGSKRGRETILRFPDRDLSMRLCDLYDWSANYCGCFRREGLQPGSRILLWIGNVPEYALAYTAALRLGLVTVPVSVYEDVEIVGNVYDTCGCSLLLYDSRNRHIRTRLEQGGALPENRIDIASFDAAGPVLLPPRTDGDYAFDWAMEDMFCILHSSGSTGKRKAIRKTLARALGGAGTLRILRALVKGYRLRHDLSIYNVCPWYHNTGNGLLMYNLCCGGFCQIVSEYFHPVHAARYIGSEKPTLWLGTATMLYRVCAANPDPDLVYPGVILSSGEALSGNVIRMLSEQKGCKLLLSTYGTTELSLISSYLRSFGELPPAQRRFIALLCRLGFLGKPDEQPDRKDFSSHLGTISRKVEIHICGEDGQVMPDGEAGEIFVKKGPGKAVYLDQEQADEFLSTGDVGYKYGDQLYLLGRKKELIIRSGENIIPSEIEEKLLLCPGVEDAVVCAVPSVDHGEDICACIQANENAPDFDAVRQRLQACLPGFMVPKYYLTMETFPYNASGKVDRKRIAENALAALAIAPR